MPFIHAQEPNTTGSDVAITTQLINLKALTFPSWFFHSRLEAAPRSLIFQSPVLQAWHSRYSLPAESKARHERSLVPGTQIANGRDNNGALVQTRHPGGRWRGLRDKAKPSSNYSSFL